MKRKIGMIAVCILLLTTLLSACGRTSSNLDSEAQISDVPGEEASKETVLLTLWGAAEDQVILRKMADDFIAANEKDVNMIIYVGIASESSAKDAVLKGVDAAADVFAFADDQLEQLVQAGALLEVSEHKEEIIEANGGAKSGAIKAASCDGTLYAYPMTADNGYFMFYSKEYFTEADVLTMDRMLEVAALAGKQITMQLDTGWYLFSFFKGAGLSVGLNTDKTNYCEWNSVTSVITGVEVTEAILEMAMNPAFISLNDSEFVTGIKDGSVIAGVNGTWNAKVAEEVWGSNYAAAKLPTYTVAGQQKQMYSFMGYKLVGVNPYSDYKEYATELAEWITDYDNQVYRFEQRNLGPSNIKAAASATVKNAPAIAAIAQQSQYADVERIGKNFWAPTATFGAILKAGNPDGTDLQLLLDNMVNGIISER